MAKDSFEYLQSSMAPLFGTTFVGLFGDKFKEHFENILNLGAPVEV